jgi:hypothetical protein
MKKISGIQTGVSGEYFAAAELSRRGFICSVTLKNTRGTDILVSNQQSSKLVGVQVKTNRKSKKEWALDKKEEELYEDNLVYIFVNLKELNELPEYYIVQSKIVADQIKNSHKKWLLQPGKKVQLHKDTPMRKFRDKNDEYKDRWEIIEKLLDT